MTERITELPWGERTKRVKSSGETKGVRREGISLPYLPVPSGFDPVVDKGVSDQTET